MRLLLLLTALVFANPVAAQCRVALVLALDVSQSVDAREYRLQSNGVADALTNPEIADLLLLMGGPIAASAFEWSGAQQRYLISDWQLLTERPALESFAESIRSHQRGFQYGPTAIGSALEAAHTLLQTAPPCDRAVVDISGDGPLNDGPSVSDVYDRLDFEGVTVNGLVVGGDTSPEITAFYYREVIRGPGAFVEVASDFEDYERAMIRKLRRELAMPLSRVE
ncbi:MAG: DUF1194 domain-containing protein [Pseudomonadota bacterium]